ncbi:sulfate adenylyltransferase subunit CysN [Candidatus Ishikawella capsulata]|uniref:Sulfate adenylyltransferase subunit 1 n=1 Tax=Candidatus Ishikawaella capsulata Mpkobe TaxID=476281 RepID=C5WCD0_9ENTR|nr:sulfate adenylyltransferase subunit CysN [Candidatus Ishikawaella capsulata]BAH82986.1 sulfate adenylyltransferase subunit 1 [Candidatus Ishikawaella capsulata Mpkobe]
MKASITSKKLFQERDLESWLSSQQKNSLLRFMTCGSVDDGKSTLIGRLLHDTNQIHIDQFLTLQNDSKKQGIYGEKVDWSLLVDGLQAEREQGITIDVAYRYFSTEKRKFIIADTPGHEQYTRNMATGASTCDLAILLIDACKGMLNQTIRHTFISTLLGINHFIVAINKMDLVNYDPSIFEKIKKEYLNFTKELPEDLDIHFIPISASEGDNVVKRTSAMQWYDGPTLLNILETIVIKKDTDYSPMCFPVQYVNRNNVCFRGYAGTLAAGTLKVGQRIRVLPTNIETHVTSIITFDGNLQTAVTGEAITLELHDDIDITRGNFLVDLRSTLKPIQHAKIDVVWMTNKPLKIGEMYDAKIMTKKVRVYIEKIHYQFDINTLQKIPNDSLSLNSIGLVEVFFTEPVIVDKYKHNRTIGNMIFIDKLTNMTIGAGMINETTPIVNNIRNYSSFEKELNILISRYFPEWININRSNTNGTK